MSLVVSVLENDLKDCYESMENYSENGDRQFARKMSIAIADYAESGNVITVDAGTISAGVFAGGGSGSIAVQQSIAENIIYAASQTMKTMLQGADDYMALQIATAIQAMITAGEVSTNVKGTVTPPTGTPFLQSGKAKGTMQCVQTALFASIKAAFAAMASMSSGGNEYLATQIANAVDVYLKAGIVKTNGETVLRGSLGTGTLS